MKNSDSMVIVFDGGVRFCNFMGYFLGFLVGIVFVVGFVFRGKWLSWWVFERWEVLKLRVITLVWRELGVFIFVVVFRRYRVGVIGS